jgi:hypothetical protein
MTTVNTRTITLVAAILVSALTPACPAAQTITPAPGEALPDDDSQGQPRIGSTAPKTLERHVIREILELAETRRVDVISLGDSNQLYFAYGWQDGWSYSLGTRYPMFATPLLGAGRHVGIGLALGVNESIIMVPLGAPAGWTLFNDPTSGIDDTPYGFLTPVIETRPGVDSGMRLVVGHDTWGQNNFNADQMLRAHFSYGVGPIGGMIFEPGIRQTLGLSVSHPPINTYAEEYAIQQGWIDYPAGVRNANDLDFNWFQEGSDPLVGPFFALYMRFEIIEQTNGFSNHTLYWTGGAGARLCAVNLQSASDEHLTGYFAAIRDLQPDDKKILIRIAFGANDRFDPEPSVGPQAGLASNTAKGVEDNHLAIIHRIKEVWQIAGWDVEELTFLLVGTHQKPVEPPGFGFRGVIADLAKQERRVGFVNLGALSDPLEMSQNEWYHEGGSHLSVEGYKAITSREIAALLDLPEDINGDCLVDTADLGLLLVNFGITGLTEKNLAADFNFDGVIDTADLGRLISRFGQSCPEPILP